MVQAGARVGADLAQSIAPGRASVYLGADARLRIIDAHQPTLSNVRRGLLHSPVSQNYGDLLTRRSQFVPNESARSRMGRLLPRREREWQGVPADASSARDITGGFDGTPGAGAAAKGARMQAARPQRVPDRYSQGCVYRWAAAWVGPMSFPLGGGLWRGERTIPAALPA